LRSPSGYCFAPERWAGSATCPATSGSTEARRVEHARWGHRDLSDVDYVYVGADGVVRREALSERVGCKGPPPVCHSRSVKLEAA
jgi:hypothetical protein